MCNGVERNLALVRELGAERGVRRHVHLSFFVPSVWQRVPCSQSRVSVKGNPFVHVVNSAAHSFTWKELVG